MVVPSNRWRTRRSKPTPKMQPPIPPRTLRRLGRASQQREPEEQEHRDDDEDRHHLDHTHGLLNSLELVRTEDEDQPGIRIGVRLQRVGDVQAARKPVDERPQVERHVPALGRDVPHLLALEHGDQLRVHPPVCLLPQRLRRVGAENRIRGPRRHVFESAGEHGRSGLELVRKPLPQLARDVYPLEERVDHLCRDGRADGVAREQLAGEIRPVVGIQHLALRPDGQRRDQQEQRRERDETPDEDLALDAHQRRFFCPER